MVVVVVVGVDDVASVDDRLVVSLPDPLAGLQIGLLVGFLPALMTVLPFPP